MKAWEVVLSQYSERDQQLLAQAADAHAYKVEAAALDLTCDGYVNGFDIRELWPFVLKRREELVDGPAGTPTPSLSPIVEPEPEEEPKKPAAKPKTPAKRPPGRPRKTQS